jgi:hypothetical protein
MQGRVMGTASPTIGSDVVGNYQSVLIAHWSLRLARDPFPCRTDLPGL